MSLLHTTCKEAAHLMLKDQDVRLPFRERLALKWHLFICKACPNFAKQLGFLRQATRRL